MCPLYMYNNNANLTIDIRDYIYNVLNNQLGTGKLHMTRHPQNYGLQLHTVEDEACQKITNALTFFEGCLSREDCEEWYDKTCSDS